MSAIARNTVRDQPGMGVRDQRNAHHSAAECVAAFLLRRVKGLAVGQRALLAEPCEPGPAGSRPFLLWGSTSVLVLQPERTGAGLWSGLARGAESVVRLETEGSVGTLSWSSAGFQWRESPN